MKFLKVLGIIIGIFVVLLAAAAIYLKGFLPDTGDPQDIKVEITPERVERGKYLANHVTL